MAVPSIPALQLLLGPGLQRCPCSCREGQDELCSSVPVTHRPLASQEAAAATGVRGQQGSALPHPAAAQLHARLEQEPGTGQGVGVKPARCLAGHVLPARDPCMAHGGEHNHQGSFGLGFVCARRFSFRRIFPGAPHPSRSAGTSLVKLKV